MSPLDVPFGLAGVALFVGCIGWILASAAITELIGRWRR